MIVNVIAAVAENGAIGRNGKLLWHLSGDLKFFRKTTTGFPVIMGRKTFESLGRPLPLRTNIVISRGTPALPDGVLPARSLAEAVRLAEKLSGNSQCFIIGGGQIYAEAIGMADRLFITRVYASPEDADTFFPDINPNIWKLVEAEPGLPEDGCPRYRFEKYERL